MARNRNAPMLIIAIVIGGIAFFLATNMMKSEKAIIKAAPKVMVASITHALDIGMALKKEDLDLVEAPADIPVTMLFTDPQLVVGKITNRPLTQGSVLRSIDLLSDADSLASLIPQGYQAMTVPVSLPSNLTSLIQVGNRVDILLTYTTGVGTQFKSITLMKNVKVLGVSGKDTGALQLTLAVTAEGSKTLAYSLKRGTLNVAIRSLDEQDSEQPEHFFTLAELFKDQEFGSENVKQKREPVIEQIEIIRGLNKEIYKFIDGKAQGTGSGEKQ